MSCLACLGLIAATIYSLRIVQKVFLGNKNKDWEINDLNVREKIVSAAMVIVIVWLGLFPQPVFNITKPALLKSLDAQKEKIIPDLGISKNETDEKSISFFRITELCIKQ
jgi:NADH-quinone oxidoreductase subunit M